MTDRPVAVTLSGVRNRTHLVHCASYVRHLLDTRTGEVVVRSLGTGGFLGRTTVSAEDVTGFLPDDPRLTVRTDPDPAAMAPGRGVDWIYLAVGAPGIKPWARMVAHQPLHRPQVVVVDEGLGTYGTWRTRRDAWVRQGGGRIWPTVRAAAVTTAVARLTDERWPLYLREAADLRKASGPRTATDPHAAADLRTASGQMHWRLNPPVADEFRRRVPAPGERTERAVYLAQPWVALGLMPAEDYLAHLRAVGAAAAAAGLDFVVRPHPADPVELYQGLPVATGHGPAEMDPEVVAARVALGANSTALLNLAALYGTTAVRVRHPLLAHLDRELGPDQRSLLDQFVPLTAGTEDLAALLAR